MRAGFAAVILIGTTIAAMAADTGPVIVIPGKAGVPVIINGREASYAVVEGDWGLASSTHVTPTVIGGWDDYVSPPVGHYYPSAGQLPGYGRLEVTPPDNRRLPAQAENYHKSWSVDSNPPRPQQQQNEPPANPPAIIVAPQINGRRR